jgi:hypothetical protein
MYIRTKDGRIIDTTKIVTGSKFMDFATNDESFRIIFKTELLAKSENLEELCDEFVGVDNTCENGHQLLRAIPYKCANFWNGGVYGAIWTDKGLIYVAKMDNDGKLVLI